MRRVLANYSGKFIVKMAVFSEFFENNHARTKQSGEDSMLTIKTAAINTAPYYDLPTGMRLTGNKRQKFKLEANTYEEINKICANILAELRRIEDPREWAEIEDSLCRCIFACLPEDEYKRIKEDFRKADEYEPALVQWIKVCVVDILHRFKHANPMWKTSAKIHLGSNSMPNDILDKIRLEGTARGTILRHIR